VRCWLGLAVGLAWSSLAACSNVDRGPVDECRDDIDCGTGSVCSLLAQGNVCVPEELPPRAALGFDIREGDLRLELTGCDPEVSRELGGSELRVQRRSSLIRSHGLRTTTLRSVDTCGGVECSGICDEQALTCLEPTDAKFVLSSGSRLGLRELPKKEYVTTADPPPPAGELAPPVSFIWPTYASPDPRAHRALVVEVTPAAELDTLSSHRRVIAETAESELDAIGTLRCQRGLFGNEGAVRTLPGAPVTNAGIEFSYAEPIATPATVLGSAPTCDDDEDCPLGWACNDHGTCGLNLLGVSAGSTVSTDDLEGGFPPAWVYTYCEELPDPVEPLVRTFTVRVTPPADSGLPSLIYALEQPFVEPTPLRRVQVAGSLCLPDWQPPQPISFTVEGKPVMLTSNELGDYRCCSTDCLPSTEPGVDPTAPPAVDSCSGFSRARFETRWFNLDLVKWAVAGCVPTAQNSDGSSGRYVRDVSDCEEGSCSVALTPGADEDPDRTYSVSIVQPAGSVFQSKRYSVQIDPETSELAPFALLPRVLLRGQIQCATTDNCVAANAVIAAERLRVESDDLSLPGPFFFEARVDAGGDFVLPLDPGVYVITAFPAVGQPGAPSRFAVVDLREDSPLLEVIDGVPNASLASPLRLDDGILVRVALEDFETSTVVVPVDIGSWKAQDEFPADLYDLNDPQTCHHEDPSRGCLIRRLRPTDATISLLISKRFQFTARRRGGDKCE
jgi:hypothetical protein